ncbi:hypothetical protein QCD85_14525 [Paenibacillus sp. PsM32]|uniref:hypothetical protein n=1 Tax=unclassified Paenibacillus TaxID=185978 RepID=UPI00263BCE18|nr:MULTISPECIES: hypothetical protein [unclassified Paenibacillus]MDN4619321.1 hypothetical protein [Paenibacillus sp. PsM32]MDQ1237145.1 hypothetical protein [Paenibacillus sp. SORGH_AS_0306]MDR6109504.1 hypothetical protein [Paenibacillus sp. SORGH_AS_0338]
MSSFEKSAEELERELTERLTEGLMQEEDREVRERRMIPSKYEIRIQTTLDPIAEETKQYRKMAKEIDGRYDEYMNKIKRPESTDDTESR